MGRIIGVDIPDGKRVDVGLTTIYGIGRKNVVGLLKEAKIGASKRVKDLTSEEKSKIQALLDKMRVEGALRQKIREDIKRLQSIGSYRGSRHTAGLPSRGQRTRSNARTKRGKRKTIGALKKEAMNKAVSGQKQDEQQS